MRDKKEFPGPSSFVIPKNSMALKCLSSFHMVNNDIMRFSSMSMKLPFPNFNPLSKLEATRRMEYILTQ